MFRSTLERVKFVIKTTIHYLIFSIFLFLCSGGEGGGGPDSRQPDGGHAGHRPRHRGLPLKLLREAALMRV